MTVKLYDTNCDMYCFLATVNRCEPDGERFAVVLDRTAFFPEGGGQYADTGKLCDADVLTVQEPDVEDTVVIVDRAAVSQHDNIRNSCEANVLDVQETDGEIIHYTDRALPVGMVVRGEIDVEKRFVRMQNHTGEHIVSGIVHSLFGFDNVGFHLGDGDVTVDYNGVLTREDLDLVETLANNVVTNNFEVVISHPDAKALKEMTYRSKLDLKDDVRIVTIGAIDCCACCAPHVRQSGEIGLIKLLDYERYKGGVRCHMLCGAWAMADYRVKYDNVQRISTLLCVPQSETADAVKNLTQVLKDKDYALSGLRRKLAATALENAGNGRNICFFADEACDMDALRYAVNLGMERASLCAGFLPAGDGLRYCIGSRSVDLRAHSGTINKAIEGRGGGQATMIQGTAAADRAKIAEFFAKTVF